MDVNDIRKLAKELGFKDSYEGVIYSNGLYDLYTQSNVVSLFDNTKKLYVFFGPHVVNSLSKKFESEHYEYVYNRIRYEFKHTYRKLVIDSL